MDQCGLTLCPGNIMASNPELCLSFGEWQHKFAHIIQLPDPNNLLAASIFFDIRNLWGNESALPRLMPYLLSLISDHPQFQRMMAENALQYRLPLSGVFDRIGHALGISDNTINLKTEALSPFVDATRILALAYGISQASTLLRLEQLEHKGAISREDAHAFQGAYKYLQLLRMQEHLQQSQNQQPLSNTLDPASLNPLERKILHESIRQAHRLQELLRFKYQL
ncbi:DUF294 nucleotidyltransferase-like domain-containing protein [Paenalcaligenes niemegkensis]|uniref:putative nucleotidyltransferase substrate binding domain-containing protein n=1 Tax=Paenalcaligenes niemegkensis TaxID=2895469 RepID=UPI002151E70D|nr:DUF294 nucleotidyltransferase-like domain-containing protein [Paenalcaligenes niemegkensis]